MFKKSQSQISLSSSESQLSCMLSRGSPYFKVLHYCFMATAVLMSKN